MAELALLASIVQIADTGYRLSLKLYTSGEAISSADRTIITISKDISLTSTVLKELGEILRRDQDEKERICSENLVQTAGNTVKDCLDAFEELDKMILKNMPNLSQGHRATRATMALERLKWPFIQPRIQLLRGSLDMLRANISLMLNVLIYARHVSDRKKSRATVPGVYEEARQKTIIEELVHAKEDYVRKFESLKLSVPASHSTPTPQMIGSRAAPAPTEGNVAPTQHTFNTLPATTFQNAPTPQYTFDTLPVTAFHNAPAPQHTFNSFSANTFQNTPASQWPLPNIPASYPIMPMDPVTVQREQHSSWQLLCHLDNLVKSLVREVYSPEYQIPAEPRSRFTGAIREIHRLEVVKAERSEPSKSIGSSVSHCYLFSPASSQYEPPSIAASQRPLLSNMFMASEDPNPPSYCKGPTSNPPIAPRRKRRFGEEERTQIQSTRRYLEYNEMGSKRAKYDAWEDSAPSSAFSWDEETYLGNYAKVPEPERNDVVDDLVKLWTLVR
ncbi:hypothetical protein JMJ35_004774 [Cladonia borealis]|uniref:Fungal N-terminal domain-containing protein n=1 Tax=Cladonia borealis TaxID=184061 RepID=A0AA39V208_9LECA|nr:hypothetical protein JMJ35_004774 [Cladonia borealis]